MKLLLVTFCILLFIYNGQSSLIATANLHVDSAAIGIGTLLFHQRDANSPVRIVGLIDGLKSNTVHGFHVHRDALGQDQLNCTAAGPHFNPYSKNQIFSI
ncbi:unnamed protein product [Adineta steineri]|uniref:Superoxide dismutase copper/zinc binding domain-containing protein n=1 Tax=Adineta steineri TaxID=433720 RepID=A0A814N119_9BILA|nr:unnamed protein product [Adineta steineri]CAF1086431.1 unnamed protein product [Adineta steineri]CAF1143826.1 unnamed protein product [Adineta steineri]CAF1241191.1 unnamed protein product [Adineta steineri]